MELAMPVPDIISPGAAYNIGRSIAAYKQYLLEQSPLYQARTETESTRARMLIPSQSYLYGMQALMGVPARALVDVSQATQAIPAKAAQYRTAAQNIEQSLIPEDLWPDIFSVIDSVLGGL